MGKRLCRLCGNSLDSKLVVLPSLERAKGWMATSKDSNYWKMLSFLHVDGCANCLCNVLIDYNSKRDSDFDAEVATFIAAKIKTEIAQKAKSIRRKKRPSSIDIPPPLSNCRQRLMLYCIHRICADYTCPETNQISGLIYHLGSSALWRYTGMARHLRKTFGIKGKVCGSEKLSGEDWESRELRYQMSLWKHVQSDAENSVKDFQQDEFDLSMGQTINIKPSTVWETCYVGRHHKLIAWRLAMEIADYPSESLKGVWPRGVLFKSYFYLARCGEFCRATKVESFSSVPVIATMTYSYIPVVSTRT